MTPVVFVHGWGVRPAVFDSLRARLKLETLAPALPGYDGASSCEPYTLSALTDVLASAAPIKCGVVGWSLGALIALAWAAARPAQVERLALIGATPCFVRRDDWSCAMKADVFDDFAHAFERDCEATLLRFAALQAFSDGAAKLVARRLRETLASCVSEDERTALAAGLRVLRESDVRQRLPAIAQPVLLVHGAQDQVVPVDAAHDLAGALPRAELMVMRDAAHAPFVSSPERVAHALTEFFDG